VRGEDVASAKLTEDEVRSIRHDDRTRREIATEYGVSKATVSSIWARRAWKHVAD
jgi:DNA invertase Pin-like site-specific DNA recombinase